MINERKVVALVQARLGSTRLPNKMLLCLKQHPILEWVLKRLLKSERIDQVVLATSVNKENDLIADLAQALGVDVFRGSENDVLGRFYSAALEANATHVVRVCADNPLISPNVVDDLVEFYFEHSECDYVYNHVPKENKYPDGLGAEILAFDLLELMHHKAKESSEREHCLNYIVNRPDEFTIKTFNPKQNWLQRPDLRFDVDTFDDYYKLQRSDININMNDTELLALFS